MTPLDLPIIGLALLARFFAIEPFTIPSSSMDPNLKIGDYLLASKSAYGANQFSLPMGQYLPAFAILRTAPKRGDVVIFRLPQDMSTTYIRRVVGLAGDRVQLKDGVVYLNDIAIKRTRIGEYHLQMDHKKVQIATEYRETLPDGRAYDIIDLSDTDRDNTEVFTVPPDHCFVLGDNRDRSADSRNRVGYVPYANIFAKTLVTVDFSGKSLKGHAVE